MVDPQTLAAGAILCTCDNDTITQKRRPCDGFAPACHHPSGVVNARYAKPFNDEAGLPGLRALAGVQREGK